MEQEQLEILRHSAAHLIAAAAESLYPGAKFGVGPVIENGFYYDIEFPQTIGEEDLQKIEAKAKELIKANLKYERKELPIDEAIKLFTSRGQVYKVELLKDLKERGTTKMNPEERRDIGEKVDTVSIYQTGDFIDLCRGPHLRYTKEIKPAGLKLMRLAGAYWRGDEKNKMLTRIYGVVFADGKELEVYLNLLAEAEKRDHRKIGKELDLFVFSELVGPGLPLYTFKGAAVRREIIRHISELQKSIGYEEVYTPNMNKAELFKVSGHYEKYKEDMFKVVSNYSDEEYFLKPMNCPQHTQIYASRLRSYKDLPIRIADFANLYRDERPGELSGLTRLRCFCQDDGHSFCREDQIKNEFLLVLGAIKQAMQTYQMNYKIRLSLWDPDNRKKYLGEQAVWEKSQKLLEEILIENKIEYYKAVGEAAIYGPKMDLISKDALGREWQISTIQLDFIMPVRFGLTYIDAEGKEKNPVMIHRAIIGSPERFLGVLIEHYAGNFPVWLAPVQIMLAPVGSGHVAGAKKLAQEFIEAGLRVEVDEADETIGNKVRKAVAQKIPYILVIGDKELAGEDLMVRVRGEEKQVKMSKKEFMEKVMGEIKARAV